MIPAPEKSNNNIVTITAAVLKLLQENGDMSVREISDEMGYKSPPSSLRNVLKALMDAGYIQYMYPNSPRAPNQRIMLK